MLDTNSLLDYLADSTEKPSFIVQELGVPSIRTSQYQARQMPIRDGRASGPFSLDQHGFALIERPTAVSDFADQSVIRGDYYAEVEELVKEETGACRVDIIDHTIRSSETTPGIRGIAAHVHNDYTERSCPRRLRDHLGDERADQLLKGRVVQINVWRPLMGPVRVAPLALLDGTSLTREDLVPCDIVYPDRRGEIYEVRHNPAHQWYYFPEMSRDEVILFKGYDSQRDGRVRFSPHTAFQHPASKADDPARISIEVRAIASFQRGDQI